MSASRIATGAGLALLLGLGFGLAQGCLLPNPDHCVNRAIDANAWCADNHEALIFCSPCEADNNGCVAEEPSEDECPSYSGSSAETGTGTGSDTGSDSDTNSDTSSDTGTG